MDKKILKNPTSKTELLRALDYFSLMFNDSHSSKKINKFSKDIKDNNGKIIFLTRLWSPERTNDIEEKKRRIQQNEFRINACKTIKQNFKNSIVGIQKDSYSLRIAKKLTVDNKITKKSSYISLLNSADIGIADDGLFDNPGWKIGEYVMTSKAIITTPINIHIDNFKENINYLKTKCRNSYNELPDLIETLISEKKYLQMKKSNKYWFDSYMQPYVYFENILNKAIVMQQRNEVKKE